MQRGTRPPGGVRRVILNALRGNPKGLLITELVKIADVTPNTALRHLNNLLREGMAKKIPAGGAAFRWFHRKATDEIMANAPKIRATNKPQKLTVALSPEDLYKFLSKWQVKWEPKIFESARNLPLGLARVFELACEQAFGSVVSDDDLNTVRINISQLRKDLEQTLRVVNGILDESRLWDRHKFVQVTLADNDVNEIRSIAFKVKEVN